MGVNPLASVLGKMADELGVSMDFLLHGSTDDKAASTLSHAEVIQQYKEVDQLPAEERSTVIKVGFRTAQRLQNKAGLCFMKKLPSVSSCAAVGLKSQAPRPVVHTK